MWQHLLHYGQAMDVDGPNLPLRAARLLHELDLWEQRDEPLHTYSSGMQRKVALARVLIADPSIVMFDEPTLELDQRSARAVEQWIAKLIRWPDRQRAHQWFQRRQRGTVPDSTVDDRPRSERESLGRRIGAEQIRAIRAELLHDLEHEVGWQLVRRRLGRKQGEQPREQPSMWMHYPLSWSSQDIYAWLCRTGDARFVLRHPRQLPRVPRQQGLQRPRLIGWAAGTRGLAS